MTAPFPAAPEDVTPEWLQGALAAGVLDGGRLRGFRAEDVGTGQVGRNVRFHLELEGAPAAAPTSVVGKFPSSDPVSRATGVVQRNYEREVRFYQELAGSVAIRTPHCFFAAFEPTRSDFVILMEDVSPARQGDQIEGCEAQDAALALDQLAALHAPHWNDAGLDAVEWLQRPSPESSKLVQGMYQAVLRGFLERFGPRLEPAARSLVESFAPRVAAWIDAAAGPTAVTHGDYRLDNMLFGTGGAAPPLVVVDWQTPGVGHPLADASYFLGAGLPVEDRRLHERELLRQYHRALRARGVSGYDFERCFEDYRRFAFSGVVMAVVASMIVGQSERGDAMFLAMAQRHCAHALDLDASALLP